MEKKGTAMQAEDRLCFSLYAASREIIKRYRPRLDELGLTYTQYIVLQVIWETGVISVRDLGRRLYLDSGTLTPVLKTLEKNGLINRRRSEKDERVLLVNATAAGAALQKRTAGIPDSIRSAVRLTDGEICTLTALANKALASLEDA